MAWEIYARYAHEAVRDGINHLLRGQSDDGFWRDYRLPPGASDVWVTAWVGWCLAQLPRSLVPRHALISAARAVASARTPAGWGYNRQTGPDADSTAWALRFLAETGLRAVTQGSELLAGYIDDHGGAHTFREAADTWGGAHPDVTALVGLALLRLGADDELVRRVRAATLRMRSPGAVWSSFWWAHPAYATAWSLELLAESGGIPLPIRLDSHDWLEQPVDRASGLDLAHRLIAAMHLRCAPVLRARIVDGIIDRSRGGSGFEPSADLLLPARSDTGETEAMLGHPDVNGFLTTSMASVALSRWLGLESHGPYAG